MSERVATVRNTNGKRTASAVTLEMKSPKAKPKWF